MRYLLDTSALLAHHRQERGWEMVQAALEDHESEIIVASVSLPESGDACVTSAHRRRLRRRL